MTRLPSPSDTEQPVNGLRRRARSVRAWIARTYWLRACWLISKTLATAIATAIRAVATTPGQRSGGEGG
ncbi:hypothetical protein [Kitasatospora sp. MAP5-34]|uniref:hypothetical protein n=1 Tax=Kitasatospora sp. MAP5-34 TaxID=3035102 RepID=UPI0024771AE9|nr:hypothetical protein [Kitasatospora sp. MAP5-34]MDH6575393.1 hypothetical protein [Kitasatospora sp. MAP5-34]